MASNEKDPNFNYIVKTQGMMNQAVEDITTTLKEIIFTVIETLNFKEMLQLPHGQRPVFILPIGYKNEEPKEKTTRGVEDLFHILH